MVLNVNDDYKAHHIASEKIAMQCSLTLRDIAARVSNSYVFTLNKQIYYTTTGSGSFQSFRSNLACRLMEAFNNLEWALKSGADKQLVKAEFEIYRLTYEGCQELNIPEFHIVKDAFERLNKSIA